jgi:hypothetical protein
VERREFLKLAGLSGGLAALPLRAAAQMGQGAGGEAVGAGAATAGPETQSRQAWRELLALLAETEARYLGPEWNISQPLDVSDGHRLLLHLMAGGLEMWLEADPERPRFVRIVSPLRKFLGDNPDAVYFSAPVRGDRSYRIRGNLAGATYTSLTIEGGNLEGRYPNRVVSALNDTQFGAAADGSYEVIASAKPQERNWLKLEPDAGTVTTRHYFETKSSAAADPSLVIPLTIEPLEDPGPAPSPTDASIAASIRRVANYVRGTTLDQPPRKPEQLPAWVSTVPNQFKKPEKWLAEEGGFGAVDNAYAMAPYVVMPDQALVIEGSFPKCRFANVVLWNRFLQSYDYVSRRISLNRKQVTLDAAGRFRMVLAHRDPGVPNWLDASGRVAGTIYWRFMLPESDPETPQAKLVALAEVAS